jgi:hypothetical protein
MCTYAFTTDGAIRSTGVLSACASLRQAVLPGIQQGIWHAATHKRITDPATAESGQIRRRG